MANTIFVLPHLTCFDLRELPRSFKCHCRSISCFWYDRVSFEIPNYQRNPKHRPLMKHMLPKRYWILRHTPREDDKDASRSIKDLSFLLETMTALPPLTDVPFNSESHPRVTKAYESCLHTEQNPAQQHLVFARILGYLILHSPSTTSREYIAEGILSSATQSELLKLGETYMNQFIRPCT